MLVRLSAATLFTAATFAGLLDAQAPTVQHEVMIPGFDYAYQMPPVWRAGWTAVRFENRGQVDHELILVRLMEGKTMADVMTLMQQDGDPRSLVDGLGGILVARPGEDTWGRILVNLEAGRTYMLICNFQDAEDAPPHTELGMVASFTVE